MKLLNGPQFCEHGHCIGFWRKGRYVSFNPCGICPCPAGGPHEWGELEEAGTGRLFAGCENCGASPPKREEEW